MPLYFGVRLGLVVIVVASREVGEGIKQGKESNVHYIQCTKTVNHSTAGDCWWITLHVNLLLVLVTLVSLRVMYNAKDQLEDATRWGLQHACEAKSFRSVSLVSACRQRAVSRRWLIAQLQI